LLETLNYGRTASYHDDTRRVGADIVRFVIIYWDCSCHYWYSSRVWCDDWLM